MPRFSIGSFADLLVEMKKEYPTVESVLRSQVGWCKTYVILLEDRALADQAFIQWRIGRDLGRHSKLQWCPDYYFFEHDTDAMAFYLALEGLIDDSR